MANVISQLYQEVEIHYVAGDALRFKATVTYRDPLDPGPDDAPNMIPYPLVGYTAAAQIRRSFKKDSALIATFTIENTLNGTGEILVYLPPDQSELLRGFSSAAWDLQITDDNDDPLTIMGGPVKPKGDATRE